MKNSKISLSKLLDILPAKEQKEYTIIYLSRPLRRGQRKVQRSTVITAVDRFTAYKKAVERYGQVNVLKTSERTSETRTDNFVTIM